MLTIHVNKNGTIMDENADHGTGNPRSKQGVADVVEDRIRSTSRSNTEH
jgi:hypothetical protein